MYIYMCWRSVTYIYVLEVSHVYIYVLEVSHVYIYVLEVSHVYICVGCIHVASFSTTFQLDFWICSNSVVFSVFYFMINSYL
jgi:hypothetical protein